MTFKSLTDSIPDAANRFTDADGVDREVPVMQIAFQEAVGTAPTNVSGMNGLPVTLTSVALPSGAATAALQETGNTSLSSIDGKLPASVAHDAADSGNPIKIGTKAVATQSTSTLVAAADRSDVVADLDGTLIARQIALGDALSGVAAITDGSSTSVIAAQGSGVKTYITSVVIANTSATAVTVDLRDGAAGSVKMTLPVPANTAGIAISFPIPLGFTANTAVCADPSASASTVTVTLLGFKSKV